MDYLLARRDEPCGRSVPEAILKAISWMERVAEYPEERRATHGRLAWAAKDKITDMQIGLRRGPRPGGRVRCRFRVKHMILRTRTCRVPFSTQIIGSQICRWLLLQHPEYCPFPETHIATCFFVLVQALNPTP